jgi:hypothetical protein
MRGVTLLALATILLAGAAGSAQAQESSSQPSAWIDGRVEMPERGVAFTVDEFAAVDRPVTRCERRLWRRRRDRHRRSVL